MKKILSIMCGLLILISSVFNVNVCAKEEIPIAMCLDNNYTLPTIVAMTSMLENVKEGTEYKYYLLVPGDFTQENKQKILSLKEKYKSKQFDKQGMWGAATYYRLRLPSVLSKYDKCIYLDGDTIINKDLSEFFNIDLEDNYLGGVKEFEHGHGSWYNKFLESFGINSSQYINAGVLLMNLKKLRDDRLEDKFKWFVENKGWECTFQDQDIINICCQGKISLLPKRYNCRGKGEDPLIEHCAGFEKPWKDPFMFLAEKWWEYAIKSGFYDKAPAPLEIKKIKKKILEMRDNPKSNAKTIDGGIYIISSKLDSNKCLAIKDGSKNNCANLQLLDRNGTDAQKFKVQYNSDGYYTIKAMCSGKMLDVLGGSKNILQCTKNRILLFCI